MLRFDGTDGAVETNDTLGVRYLLKQVVSLPPACFARQADVLPSHAIHRVLSNAFALRNGVSEISLMLMELLLWLLQAQKDPVTHTS